MPEYAGFPNIYMELQYEQELHVRKSLVIRATQLAGGLFLKKLI